MLEVHPLHKRLHGVGEFFLHLVAITIGLLIATQIESCVEWRAHRHIAAEAREALHKEIAGNLKVLRDAQPSQKQWRALAKDGVVAMQRVVDHPNDPAAQPHSFNFGCGTVGDSLDNTAWKTAQSTGALGYMPYEEASAYVNIYQAQERLLAAELRPCDDATAVFGLLSQYHTDIDWKSKKISEGSKITREEAAAIANKLGEMRMHLDISDIYFEEYVEFNAAFMEGRTPRENLGGSLD
jgi:hypothetical protein